METPAPKIILIYTAPPVRRTHRSRPRTPQPSANAVSPRKGHLVNVQPRFGLRLLLGAATLLAFALLFDAPASPGAEETARQKEIDELKAQIKALTKRLEEIEATPAPVPPS